MSKWRLVSSEDGQDTFHRYDHEAKKTIVKTTDHNVEPLLAINARKAADADRGWRGDMHHVASIPPSVWNEWWREFGGNPMAKENRHRLMAKLNNQDWCKLRTKAGRI